MSTVTAGAMSAPRDKHTVVGFWAWFVSFTRSRPAQQPAGEVAQP